MAQTSQPVSSSEKTLSPGRALLLAAAGYLILTLLMFGDVLFTSKEIVLSNGGTDIFGQFLSWRKFGFEQLRQGHIPLWNPYVFCGAPYFGGFQSALLYPLNALYLVLPLTTAINYSIALHVFLAGLFVYLWASYRKLHPLACFLAGVIWMFSGPYFVHIYAGHLSNLCTMIWAPLFFLAVDGTLDKPSRGWTLLGIFALAMQILAGHPQYVFYTSFIAGIYVLFRLGQSAEKKKTILCFTMIYIGAVLLASVQLFTGAQATAESIRSVGLSPNFASSFSFPPENFLTFLAPDFFGNMKEVPYWGRWLFWEMCLFCGVSGFVLAGYGAIVGSQKQRNLIVLMLLLSCVFALGANTKLFDLLYAYVPGFNKFRSNSKFIFLTAMFLSLLVAMGFDDILQRRRPIRPLIYATVALAVSLIVGSVCIQHSATAGGPLWRSFTDMVGATEQSTVLLTLFKDADSVRQWGIHAAHSLLVAGGTVAAIAVVLILIQFSRRSAILLVMIGVVEMFVFARSTRDTFDAAQSLSELRDLFAKPLGDGRLNFAIARNLPMYFGQQDIWGNDPGIPLRYAQFMAFTQKVKPEFAAEFDVFRLTPFFRALRCQYAVSQRGGKLHLIERADSLPHFQLVKSYRVITEQKRIFAALEDSAFDPRAEVILESDPRPLPDANGVDGTVKLTDYSTDFLELEAELPSAAILLITDSYTAGWHARSLPGSSQAHYDLLPGDYCLRAVPLAAGHHRLRVEYTSKAFTVGKWISISSLIAYLTVLVWHVRTSARKCRSEMISNEPPASFPNAGA
ncbi:MAG: hypothetical protein JWM68_1430 [Verrucomicrobiales bacterium]|nr:hypothetical protein [Verrucomicrobiales bacterium]